MKRNLFLLAIMAVLSTTIYAQTAAPRRGIPAKREPIDVVQPNGDTLTIRLVGDEWHHFRMTVDGYLIRENKKGYYCYAKYNKKGETVCTWRKAHNADKRTKCEKRYIEKHIPNKLNNKQED